MFCLLKKHNFRTVFCSKIMVIPANYISPTIVIIGARGCIVATIGCAVVSVRFVLQ